MSITGSSAIRRFKDVAIVANLDKLAPVGGWAPGRRHRWWLERFAEMCQDLSDRARLGDERNQPDVAAAVRALEWKLLAHPGHELCPGDP